MNEYSPNLRRLVLCFIDADFCKYIFVGKLLREIYKMYIYASLGEKNRIENTFAPLRS